jgi:hypothetical protein
MGVTPPEAGMVSKRADWRDPQSYQWLRQVSKPALAWEFLRRNKDYQEAFERAARGETVDPSRWALVRFEDPAHDARCARPIWRRGAFADILPLHASAPIDATALLRFGKTKPRFQVSVVPDSDNGFVHVLMAQAGRFLQIEMRPQRDLSQDAFLTPALAKDRPIPRQLLSLRRLDDALAHGELRPQLYPADRRADRFARILLTLDGVLANARHREIASSLYGADRVDRDWTQGGTHLRDHVRRAATNGRQLMESGFSRLLACPGPKAASQDSKN